MFFNYYLKDKGVFNAAEATVFETGTNRWRTFNAWPPANVKPTEYYMSSDKKLSLNKPTEVNNFDEYTSDPANPVPYTKGVFPRRNNAYMAEDQSFAAARYDVLFYQTDTLTEDVTLAGNIIADLKVSLSSTDADFIVKLIDVLPANEPAPAFLPNGTNMGGPAASRAC